MGFKWFQRSIIEQIVRTAELNLLIDSIKKSTIELEATYYAVIKAIKLQLIFQYENFTIQSAVDP